MVICSIAARAILTNLIQIFILFYLFVYFFLLNSRDHDSVVTFVSTEAWIKSLNYPISDDWRPWLIYGQFAG